MELFLKAISGVFVAIAMCLVISKHSKEGVILISVAMCCMIASVAMTYLQPAISFFSRMEQNGNLDPEIMQILFKATGVAILSEISSLICIDAGNGTLGKTIQLLATAAILWLSLPLFSKLLSLIENILVSL